MIKRFLCLLLILWTPGSVLAGGSESSLPYEILDQGSLSGAVEDKPALHIIHDQTSWDVFWAKHQTITPKKAAQHYDFGKKEILAIVDSDQPNSGYHLILDKLEKREGELLVYVTREQPAARCMNLGMVSQPYVFVLIDRFEGKVKMVFNTKTATGC